MIISNSIQKLTVLIVILRVTLKNLVVVIVISIAVSVVVFRMNIMILVI